MLKRRMRNLAVTGVTIVSATVLTALFATGASASVTATANPGHTGAAATTDVHATPAAANASAAPDSSAQRFYVCSFNPHTPGTGGFGCIDEPGHGGHVGTAYVRNITLNLVLQTKDNFDGQKWYELRFNGTTECLNLGLDGFVYEDSCVPNDPFEEWEHHGIPGDSYVLKNEASFSVGDNFPALATCMNRNSLLTASEIPSDLGECLPAPSPDTGQIDWEFIPA